MIPLIVCDVSRTLPVGSAKSDTENGRPSRLLGAELP